MLVRAGHVKNILTGLGVSSSQVEIITGKNLGKSGDSRDQVKYNQRVVAEFY